MITPLSKTHLFERWIMFMECLSDPLPPERCPWDVEKRNLKLLGVAELPVEGEKNKIKVWWNCYSHTPDWFSLSRLSPIVGRTLANDGRETALRMRAELADLSIPPSKLFSFGSLDSFKRSFRARGHQRLRRGLSVFLKRKRKISRMHVPELLFCEVLKKRRKSLFEWN